MRPFPGVSGALLGGESATELMAYGRNPRVLALPLSEEDSQIQEAVDRKADPEVNDHAPVEGERLMAGAGRKVGTERKVERVTGDDRNQRFEPPLGVGTHDQVRFSQL